MTKIDLIRNTIRDMIDASIGEADDDSITQPTGILSQFTIISPESFMSIVTASKSTTCSLDPIPTSLFKELLPVFLSSCLLIVNRSLSVGLVPSAY